MLSICPFDISVDVGAFLIGLSQISSLFSAYNYFLFLHSSMLPLNVCNSKMYIPFFSKLLALKHKERNADISSVMSRLYITNYFLVYIGVCH